ncbi:MAG: chorismate synthase [Thermoproteota archaeon]
MGLNTLGRLIVFSFFGESHGRLVGSLIQGFPAGLRVDEDRVRLSLSRRRVGYGSTARVEEDSFEILTGVFKGFTTGAPLLIVVWNKEADPGFYERIRNTPRPSHVDYPYRVRYGGFNDYRGGGFSSGRFTAAWVAAGSLAAQLLEGKGVRIYAHVTRIGGAVYTGEPSEEDLKKVYESPVRCVDTDASTMMMREIEEASREGDSVGGVVECRIYGVSPGLGDPLLEGLDVELARAVMSIPGVKGVEFGRGFEASRMRGSVFNDELTVRDGRVEVAGVSDGGVVGGVSTGGIIVFRAAFKPTPSIARVQRTVNLEEMRSVNLDLSGGRFDVCIAPRAVPVVEAVSAMVLVDHYARAGLVGRVAKD